jgi:hypothetical protein
VATKATVTTTQQATIAPKILKQLRSNLHGYGAIQKEMKGLDAAKKGHSDAVLQLSLEGVDGDKYEIEGYKVAVVKGARDRRLDKDALIKRLVGDGKYSMKAALALIDDCTSDKPKKDHVRITVPGEDDE